MLSITVPSGSIKDAFRQAVVTGLLEKRIFTEDSEAKLENVDKKGVTDAEIDMRLKQLDVKLKVQLIKFEQM